MRKNLRWNIHGITFRFRILFKYLFFVSTIRRLVKEREDLATIIRTDYPLMCTVKGADSLEQIQDKLRIIHKFYEEHNALRNFRSTIIHEKIERDYFNITSQIEYMCWLEYIDNCNKKDRIKEKKKPIHFQVEGFTSACGIVSVIDRMTWDARDCTCKKCMKTEAYKTYIGEE